MLKVVWGTAAIVWRHRCATPGPFPHFISYIRLFTFLFFKQKIIRCLYYRYYHPHCPVAGGRICIFDTLNDLIHFFKKKLWMRKEWMAGADRRPKLINWNVKWLPWSMIFVFVFPTNFSCFGRHFWLLTDCFSTHMVTAKDLQLLPPRTSRCLFLFIFFLFFLN